MSHAASSGDRRSKVPLFRRPSFWSGVAATLGLAATLWATLVVKTVPELLRSQSAEIRHFRGEVQDVCGGVMQWTQSRSGNSLTAVLSPWTGSGSEHPGTSGMYDAEASWARLDPPDIYADEYEEFRRGWTRAFGATYLDFPGGQSFAIALVRWRIARHSPARRRRSVIAINRTLARINQSLGTVVVNSIAMSLSQCRRAADTLRDKIADTAPV